VWITLQWYDIRCHPSPPRKQIESYWVTRLRPRFISVLRVVKTFTGTRACARLTSHRERSSPSGWYLSGTQLEGQNVKILSTYATSWENWPWRHKNWRAVRVSWLTWVCLAECCTGTVRAPGWAVAVLPALLSTCYASEFGEHPPSPDTWNNRNIQWINRSQRLTITSSNIVIYGSLEVPAPDLKSSKVQNWNSTQLSTVISWKLGGAGNRSKPNL